MCECDSPYPSNTLNNIRNGKKQSGNEGWNSVDNVCLASPQPIFGMFENSLLDIRIIVIVPL